MQPVRGAVAADQPRVGQASHEGRLRSQNEDCLLVDPARGLYAVIDGMGGEAAGEQAARIAYEQVRLRLGTLTGTPDRRMREAITLANNKIFEAAMVNPAWQGMGCVLTVALVEDGQVTVGHVGDTRLYQLRGGRIRKVTPDHSPVGEREDAGALTEQEAMRHPRRNLVFRDVGTKPRTPDDEEFIDILQVPFPTDGVLLLCSDGLTDQVPSDRILRVLQERVGDPQAAADTLVADANRAGGKDNVSIIVVEGPDYGPARRAASPVERARPAAGRNWLGPRLVVDLLAIALLALLLRHWLSERPVPGPAAASSPRVLRVGGAGALYTTIQEAMAAAQAGDTVLVTDGDYPERVQLKDGVLLRAARHRAVRVSPPAGAESAPHGVIIDGATSGTVAGLHVSGGVWVRSSSVVLEGLEVTGARAAGVEIGGASRVLLTGSRIHGNAGPGVLVHDSAEATLLHNHIHANGRQPGTAPRPGIEVQPPAQARLESNLVAENGAEALWAASGGVDEAATLRDNSLSGPRGKVRRIAAAVR